MLNFAKLTNGISMNIPIESLNFQLLNVGFVCHDGDWNWKSVVSPFTRLYLVTEGYAKLHLPDRIIELNPGYMYMIPAHTVHSYECKGKFSHYYLHFYEGFKAENNLFELYSFPDSIPADSLDESILANMCRHYPETVLPASDPSAYDFMGRFVDYVHRYNEMPLDAKIEIRGSILLLVSHFVGRAVAKVWTEDERMSKVLNYIHDNICSPVDIDMLASIACVTKPHFIRLFSKKIGLPPLQYINKKKIEHAELLLIMHDIPVKEVAYELGYNDQSYFIRLFKKITGITPMVYRRNMK